MPNFKKFGAIFVIFEIFNAKKRIFQQVRSATGATLLLGVSICKKVCIFGISMKKYACSGMAEIFGQVPGLQKAKKHSNSALSATFLPHRKQSWEIPFLERQVNSKSKNSSFSRR